MNTSGQRYNRPFLALRSSWAPAGAGESSAPAPAARRRRNPRGILIDRASWGASRRSSSSGYSRPQPGPTAWSHRVHGRGVPPPVEPRSTSPRAQQGKTVFAMTRSTSRFPRVRLFRSPSSLPVFSAAEAAWCSRLHRRALSITALPSSPDPPGHAPAPYRLRNAVLASAMVNDLSLDGVFGYRTARLHRAFSAASVADRRAQRVSAVAILTAVRTLINQALPWSSATRVPEASSPSSSRSRLYARRQPRPSHPRHLRRLPGGIAIGDSPHLRAHTRDIINQF
jgi:hypothetical protein